MELADWMKVVLCCTPYVGGVLTGVYSTVTYLTAFGMELGWIIESQERLPSPAYILTAGYFSTFLISLFLLVGLILKHCKYLLVWLIVMTVFFFPECGLVLYMSLYYWDLGTSHGLAEFVFYVCRAVLNVLCVVCIHLLYGSWKKEKAALHRLENFHVGAIYSHLTSVSGTKNNSSTGNGHLYRCTIQDDFPAKRFKRESSSCDDSVCLQGIKSNSWNHCRQMEPAYGPFRSQRSEFDVTTFNQYLAWQLKCPSSIYGTVRSRGAMSDIGIPNCGVDNSKRRSVALYGTLSGVYRTHPRRQGLRKSRSLSDLNYNPRMVDRCVLEKLNQSSFCYMQRPVSLALEESDSDSLHNISDVAL